MSRLKDIAAKLHAADSEPIPKGWESLKDIAAAERVLPETARRQLKRAEAAGLVEAKKFRVYTGHQMNMVTHWRFPDAPKPKQGKRRD